jgi:hypothetical protein
MDSLADIRTLIEKYPSLLRNIEEVHFPDTVIEKEVAALEKAAVMFHIDPYYLDENLSDVSTMLSRILGFRREISAIESERVRAVLGYLAAEEQASADADIEKEKNTEQKKELDTAIDTKKEAIIRSIKLLEQRHGTTGSALNYAERILKLEEQMRMDVRSAYRRSKAIMKALDLFGYRRWVEIPKNDVRSYASFEGARFLDDWCKWHRLIVQYIERQEAVETEIEFSLSLGMKFNRSVNGVVKQVALVEDLLGKIRRNEAIKFKIDPYKIGDYTGIPKKAMRGSPPRVRAIGITVTMPPDAEGNWNFQVGVGLPSEPLSESSIMIGGVGSVRDGIRWVAPAAVKNRLVQGEWTVSFDEEPTVNGSVEDKRRLDRNLWPLWDVQLHLKVVSGLIAGADDWQSM